MHLYVSDPQRHRIERVTNIIGCIKNIINKTKKLQTTFSRFNCQQLGLIYVNIYCLRELKVEQPVGIRFTLRPSPPRRKEKKIVISSTHPPPGYEKYCFLTLCSVRLLQVEKICNITTPPLVIVVAPLMEKMRTTKKIDDFFQKLKIYVVYISHIS